MTQADRRKWQEGPKESKIKGIVCPDCEHKGWSYDIKHSKEFPEGALCMKCKRCGCSFGFISWTEIECYEKCRDKY